ncbi:MAG: signal peptidase I [Candidatus Nanopelagicaceae bacterium]|nr:signal peptidase I [Candidatus Nanopelagicaceae bacterium]
MKKAEKEKRRVRFSFSTLVWSIIPTIALISIFGYAGLAIVRHVYPPIVPVSGTSMLPLLRFGDLVLIKKADYGNLRKGDIIAFRTTADVQQKWNVPGSYVHRIVAVQSGEYGQQFQTKGDNVSGKDPFWTVEQNVIGIYDGKIGGGGYPILFIRSRQGKILMGGILLISFLYWLLGIFERRRFAQDVNVHNLATVVDEARKITARMEEGIHAPPAGQVLVTPAGPATLRPKDWIISGDFLSGTLSPQAPAEIVLAQKIGIALEGALANSNWPSYEVATRAQVPIPVMNGILEGEFVPDLTTLAQLGKVLSFSFLTIQ